MFFEGFGEPEMLDVDGQPIRLRRAGQGPPVLLLHGHPQTHAMWHALAPRLAADFSVICPDLPGYGGSQPAAGANMPTGSRHSLARRMFDLLSALGTERVSVVGHDRGGSVAHQMAVSCPERVERLALLEIVPMPDSVEREDMAFALATYRMFWFAQRHPKPEALFQDEPNIWLPGTLPGSERPLHFHPEAVADYLTEVEDTSSMTALNEAYRTSVERDLLEERLSRTGGQRATCPTLVLWGARGRIGGWYDPVHVWRERSTGPVSGMKIQSGHFMAEEQPDEVAAALTPFLHIPVAWIPDALNDA